jgi:hypothetical protein
MQIKLIDEKRNFFPSFGNKTRVPKPALIMVLKKR